MNQDEDRHVFVSYVHEDNPEVDSLCRVLEAARIPYWRDRTSLGPGDAWKAKIRGAIRDGSLVFLACFSEHSRAKDKSHMNEELTIAIEEYRKMPPGRTWLVPIRFDSGRVPEWDLGAGRILSDLNYSDLFGEKYAAEAASLVTTIHRVMGEKQLSPAATLEAVDQATAANRPNILRRLTKEMLVDPTRRIELDDLVTKEAQRIVKVVTDPQWVATPPTGTEDEQILHLASEAQDLLELTTPFCASLEVAAHWGEPATLAPWARGIQSLVHAANRRESGYEGLLRLRHLPGLVSIMTAALACVANGRWGNLKKLVVDGSVRDPYQHAPLALLEATDPYRPFDRADWISNTLALTATSADSLAGALEDLTQKRTPRLYMPVAEWLHTLLRPIFEENLPDNDIYSADFDRMEVVLGVLAQDTASMNHRTGTARSRWFGRSTWRAAHYNGNPITDLRQELDSEGALWPPLRDGLFGGDADRAKTAIDSYAELFNELSRAQRF